MTNRDRGFLLTQQPLSILEHLSAFLRNTDQAKLMLTCKAMFEIYARSLWRKISISDGKIGKMVVTGDIWARYGQFIHTISIDTHLDMVTILPAIPNVAKICIWLEKCVFDAQIRKLLEELQHFRHVTFYSNWAALDEILAAIEWCNSAAADRLDSITWNTMSFDELFLSKMDHLINGIRDIKRHRFEITDRGEMSAEQVAAVGPHCCNLNYGGHSERRCINTFYQSLLGENQLVFTQLRRLALRVCCDGQQGHGFKHLSQNHFPVLKSFVVMFKSGKGCILELNNVLDTIFAQPWPSLISINITCDSAGVDFLSFLQHAPNLVKFRLETNQVHLSSASYLQEPTPPLHPPFKLRYLVDIQLVKVLITKDMLQLIVTLFPRLCSLSVFIWTTLVLYRYFLVSKF
ncbi:hypothetical protein GQ42DRAFT_178552 [Ramicandelaber brevisporus]|nr:hypothetical protein GQ42DRAFT_178552 [Ramicandelaber brevisporus]